MIWSQRDFWRTFLAWQLDGCPEPRMWYSMRRLGETTDLFARRIGAALLPAFLSAHEAIVRFAAVYASLGKP